MLHLVQAWLSSNNQSNQIWVEIMQSIKAIIASGIVALGLLSTNSAVANNVHWKLIGKNHEYLIYMSPSSVREISKNQMLLKQAWFKFDIHTDFSKDGLNVGDYKLRYYQFDCQAQTMGVASELDYLNDGTIAKEFVPSNVQMKPIVPNSIGHKLASHICG